LIRVKDLLQLWHSQQHEQWSFASFFFSFLFIARSGTQGDYERLQGSAEWTDGDNLRTIRVWEKPGDAPHGQ
jgi:hypothetical protein